ncbi:MAG: DNA topoisomerase, partial [Rhizonema sp. PD38]|nr:DNA topoisomerase [Rhizonema sp. PD38]
ISTLKKRGYVQLTKENLQPSALGLEVDAFLLKALPDLLATEFTAKMEDALDAIAEGKQPWQYYLTTWNQNYFAPALAKAKTVSFTSNTKSSSGVVEGKFETSRTRCPQCKNPLAKIKSSKLKKKFFLKCVNGCVDVVLFWSDRNKTWEQPRSQAANVVGANPQKQALLTTHPCPVCKKPLEEYSYMKDGQSKILLRCSNPQSRNDQKHKEVAYFNTANGWWSPKFGELKPM